MAVVHVPPSAPHPGLSAEEAGTRLLRDGPNELPARRASDLWARLRGLLEEPMLLLLAGTTVLYALLGSREDALAMAIGVGFVMGMSIFQQGRAHRALEALRAEARPWTLALRDARATRVLARDLVVGDWIVVSAGERMAADAILREGKDVRVDESLLTGEAMPVEKVCRPSGGYQDRSGGTDPALLRAGTLLRSGRGLAEVIRTGRRSEAGRIGASLETIEGATPRRDSAVQRMVGQLSWLAFWACAFATVTHALRQGGTLLAWRDGALAGMALAISLIPKELPVVTTIFLALGAWRLTRARVLTRRLMCLATLGNTDVLCVDKTGTLTMNRMALVIPDDQEAKADAPWSPVELGLLASPPEADDPMEQALGEAWLARKQEAWRPPAGWHPQTSVRPGSGWMGSQMTWLDASGAIVLEAAKGAPEQLLAMCPMSPSARQAILAEVTSLAVQGKRVLGIAWARPAASDPAADCPVWFWGGLLAFDDPLRPGVAAAVARCREAGIRVIMLTGDHPATALAKAAEAGIDTTSGCASGSTIRTMSSDQLRQLLTGRHVFARVHPEDKLRLVQALQADGCRVTMTGDGVNDAPALLAAQVGVAMGKRGSDVARESADLILLEDDFPALVSAIAEARTIHSRLRRAASFIVSAHIPIATLALLPAVAPSLPLILLPIHLVLLEGIIDPSCTLVLEADKEDDDVMKQTPRADDAPLLEPHALRLAVSRGLAASIGSLAATLFTWQASGQADMARTAGFLCLIATLPMILHVSRGPARRGPLTNPAFALLLLVIAAGTGLVSRFPILQHALHLASVPGAQAVAIGCMLTATLGVIRLSSAEDMPPHAARPGAA
ncbi:MAG: cation-translocating P-type ATPase [Candidatus Sericytochromatia bacterium]|nr:cation-translocating P-type ATPase [Candidatus Sericytochromatia bacterium]